MIYKYIKNILNKFTTQTLNESDTDSSSVRSDSSSNEPNYIYVGSNTVDTINIKQKSKKDNFIIMHTKPDTTININIEQKSNKNNYVIINPVNSDNKDIPQNIGTTTRNGDTHDNKYDNYKSTTTMYNDRNDNQTIQEFNKCGDVNITNFSINNFKDEDDNLNELKHDLKNDSKNEPKDDNGKSGGNGLSGSGSIPGGDSDNDSSSAGPSNFRSFLDQTIIILITIITSILDAINDIFTLM